MKELWNNIAVLLTICWCFTHVTSCVKSTDATGEQRRIAVAQAEASARSEDLAALQQLLNNALKAKQQNEIHSDK